MNAIIESNWVLTINNMFYKIGDFLHNNWLTVNIKWKVYPNRTGFRQLAMHLWISLEITKESRIQTDDYFLYEYSVKATSKDGRYTECSASCSSNERDFNNLENDVRTIAQTRASNRAIADLVWITDITKYINTNAINNTSQHSLHTQDAYICNNDTKANSEYSEHSENTKESNNITPRQKELLVKLIQEVFTDKEEQSGYIDTLDELTKQEANFHIKQLLEEKNTKG